MATNNTESVNFKVSTMGNPDVDERAPCKLNRLTLEKVHRWIQNRDLDDVTKAHLKKMCSVYPEEALENWLNNFTIHLSRARTFLAKNQPVRTVEPAEALPELPKKNEDTQSSAAPHVEEFE